MAETRRRFGLALAVMLLAGALALPFVGGYPLAYALAIVSLLLIAWWLLARPRPAEMAEPTSIIMALAVLLVAVALAATAKEPRDLLYTGNFAMLVLFAPLRAALARIAFTDAARWVAFAALAGSAIAAAVAVLQVTALGETRAKGFGSDPIWAAQAALLTGFLALCGLSLASGFWRYLLLLGPALGLLAVLLTGSRGPLLAAVPLFAIAIIAAPGQRLRIATGSLGVLAVTGIAALAFLPHASTRAQALVEGIAGAIGQSSASDPSLGSRAMLYRASVEAFMASPLAGHGWEQRLAAAYARVPGGEAAVIAADPMMVGNHHLHADVLDLGVGAGTLGLLAYVLIIVAPVAGALASPRDGQRPARILGCAILSASYLFCGLSYILLGYEFPTTLYAVIAALLLGFCRDPQTAAERRG